MDRARAVAEAALGALPTDAPRRTFEGTPADVLTVAEAAYYLGDNRDVSRALGIPVDRSPVLERGRFLFLRDGIGAGTRIVVGTRVVDPLEVVRRDSRRIVREGMARAGVVTHPLRHQHAKQREAEDFLDTLVGAPLEWPT